MMQGYVYVEVNDKLRQLLNTIFTDELVLLLHSSRHCTM